MSLSEATQLFHNGAFDECLDGLLGSSEHGAAILGTRCYLRTGRIAQAKRCIEAYWLIVRQYGTDLERGQAATLRAAVASKSGNRELALSAFSDARGYLFSSQDCENAMADLDVHQAIFALNEGDLKESAHCATVALEHGAIHERIAARGILALIKGAQNDMRGQLSLFLDNLRELTNSFDNHFLLASNLQNVAMLAQQQDRFDLFESLLAVANRTSWVTSTQRFQSDVYRELGVLASRTGNHLAAFRFLRLSADVATSPLQRLQSILDGAVVAREIDERIGSADRVQSATDLAATLDWSTLSTADRLTILTLAAEQARIDTKLARSTMQKLYRHKRLHPNNTGPAADNRYYAMTLHVNALIERYDGELELAKDGLEAAFTYWKSIDFRWTAATIALELYELTGESCSRAYVEKYIRGAPNADIKRRLEAIGKGGPA